MRRRRNISGWNVVSILYFLWNYRNSSIFRWRMPILNSFHAHTLLFKDMRMWWRCYPMHWGRRYAAIQRRLLNNWLISPQIYNFIRWLNLFFGINRRSYQIFYRRMNVFIFLHWWRNPECMQQTVITDDIFWL